MVSLTEQLESTQRERQLIIESARNRLREASEGQESTVAEISVQLEKAVAEKERILALSRERFAALAQENRENSAQEIKDVCDIFLLQN